MAVEATNLNLFPPQLIQNRDMMNSCNQTNAGNLYSSQQQMFFPAMIPSQSYYQLPAGCDSLPHVNTDSGITCNIPTPPRKRQRDSINDVQFYATPNLPQKYNNNSGMIHQLPSFVGDEILPQMKQHHFEIDTIISHHTKRIRLALDERLKQHARLLTAAIEQGVAKKLKEKDEQITKMGRMNVVLQERLKSLYVENQLWRDLAQSNEATANSLRSDLEHVIRELPLPAGGNNAVEEDDAESCCGSSGGHDGAGKDESNSFHNNKLCRRCGEKDSCVLLLPCRHLCLCDACGAALQSCPVCQANVTATLHVNLSSS